MNIFELHCFVYLKLDKKCIIVLIIVKILQPNIDKVVTIKFHNSSIHSNIKAKKIKTQIAEHRFIIFTYLYDRDNK